MKMLYRPILLSLLMMGTVAASAEEVDPGNDVVTQQIDTDIKAIATYLVHLGGYFGYDLTKAASDPVSDHLLNPPLMQLAQSYVFNTVLGAIPVNAMSNSWMQFVPKSNSTYSPINAFANYTFSKPGYNTAATQQQGTVSVTPLIDQKTYQQDPVSQSILNILGTPDYTYCMDNDATNMLPDCKLLHDNLVMTNVIGTIPSTDQFFSYDYNQQFLSQLNGNTLISPLLYSTESNSQSSSSTQPTTNGLSAQSQAQQAANFIRYATSAVAPVSLPKHKDYDQLYGQIINKNNSPTVQWEAQGQLANYLTSLRVYAAQTSVGVGNLYYLLSKRMPQSQSTTNTTATSQALSEFTMATWRLYNPDQATDKQWLNQINQASSATVQKEIAILLSEINYQLYLSRQQEERMLLTNTMMLLQNARSAQPNAGSLNTKAPS